MSHLNVQLSAVLLTSHTLIRAASSLLSDVVMIALPVKQL